MEQTRCGPTSSRDRGVDGPDDVCCPALRQVALEEAAGWMRCPETRAVVASSSCDRRARDRQRLSRRRRGPRSRHPRARRQSRRSAGVRELGDALEKLVADDLWPLPKYAEILFISKEGDQLVPVSPALLGREVAAAQGAAAARQTRGRAGIEHVKSCAIRPRSPQAHSSGQSTRRSRSVVVLEVDRRSGPVVLTTGVDGRRIAEAATVLRQRLGCEAPIASAQPDQLCSRYSRGSAPINRAGSRRAGSEEQW